MKLQAALREATAKTGVSWLVIAALMMSLATNVLQSLHAATATTTHRETFVPPTADKPFWVEDERVSREYTKFMGLWALDRLLNVSGFTAAQSGELLLPWVHPAAAGNVQAQITAQANRLREAQAATTWIPQDYAAFESQHAIVIRGLVTTYVGDRITSRVTRAFWVRLERSSGSWHIAEIREVKPGAIEGAAIEIEKKKAEEEKTAASAQQVAQ